MKDPMKPLRILPAIVAILGLQLGAVGSQAQTLSGGPRPVAAYDPAPASAPLRVDMTAGAGAQNLQLPKGKSAIIELPVDVRDVLITNPAVADAVVRTPRRIYIVGLAAGQTDAVFFDAAGRRLLQLNIRVDQDPSAIAETINRVLPGANVRIEPMGDSIILTGMVQNAADADKANQIAVRAVGKPELVLNMLGVAGRDQVMVKVRIVEVQRNVVKQLGMDLNAILGQLGGDQLSFATQATFGINGALLGGLSGGYSLDTTKAPVMQLPCGPGFPADSLCPVVVRGPNGASNYETATAQDVIGDSGLNKANATIKAFERVGLVRTLAEPNLSSSNGEPANFLAGGEFPVPVGQDTDGRVTIEFKKYGVGLGFTPIVQSGGRITLKLSVEVSELSNAGAFSIQNGAGAPSLTIPGLSVRRAENTIEMPSGATMMIAGLLKDQTSQNLDSLPGLMNVPVLGSLFRSRDFLSNQTELVILVTPYIVDPRAPQNYQTPADGLQLASDPATILLGKLNKTSKAPPRASPARPYQGPVGYVIE